MSDGETLTEEKAAARPLPSYGVVAFNYATESNNRIHDDTVAREHGFRGGLVPGVADYAYLSGVAVDALGMRWLEEGWGGVDLLKPVYDGDTVAVSGRLTESDGLEAELHDSEGTLCAAARFGLGSPPEDWFSEPAIGDEVPVLETPYSPTRESLDEGDPLASLPMSAVGEEELEELARKYRDDRAAYRQGWLHPAYLLDRANRCLAQSIALGPWIHTRSRVRHQRRVDPRRQHRLDGVIEKVFEKKGHLLVTARMVVVCCEAESVGTGVVAEIAHTAIVRLRGAAT